MSPRFDIEDTGSEVQISAARIKMIIIIRYNWGTMDWQDCVHDLKRWQLLIRHPGRGHAHSALLKQPTINWPRTSRNFSKLPPISASSLIDPPTYTLSRCYVPFQRYHNSHRRVFCPSRVFHWHWSSCTAWRTIWSHHGSSSSHKNSTFRSSRPSHSPNVLLPDWLYVSSWLVDSLYLVRYIITVISRWML
jgi:hypothetical protein